jgi:D-3-phosphoglycerate dehydrogenase
MPKALITTVPFADKDPLPLKLLASAGVEYVINPFQKKLTADQLAGLIPEFDILIAGTEEINAEVLSNAKNLKFISRVGIGLDSVDLTTARENGIIVSYTPDAPAAAVAELTMGHILSLLRLSHISNRQMHQGQWHRYFGRRLAKVTVGIIGAGRIGSSVLRHLTGFMPEKVLVNDVDPNKKFESVLPIEWCSKERIYSEADVISIHVPLTGTTKGMVDKQVLLLMKNDAILVNTSRGGIVNEEDLYLVMKEGHLAGAAIDVFEQEPYDGPLKEIERCILTAHMGSMSVDCRTRMEIEATEEAIRFLKGQPLEGEVPENEYEEQKRSRK